MQYKEGITDTQILEKILDIYYNVISNLQANIKIEMAFSNQLESELIQYNYFENFYDILTRYFIERYVTTCHGASILSIDYLPYLFFVIVNVLVGSFLIAQPALADVIKNVN